MNFNDLLDRAKQGDLSDREVDAVAAALERADPSEDPYTLLHILGISRAQRHRPLVERYLRWFDDPMLARLALQILCSHWGETREHLDYVRSFVSGDPRDPGDDVRIAAIAIAGEHLRNHQDRELIAMLIGIFDAPTAPQIVRESAYFALARASGLDRKEMPSAARHFDLERDVRLDVINRFRQLVM
jgi:hypothetical protein